MIKLYNIPLKNQYCSTYQSVPLFWLSWEKVEIKTEKSLPYCMKTSNPISLLIKFPFEIFESFKFWIVMQSKIKVNNLFSYYGDLGDFKICKDSDNKIISIKYFLRYLNAKISEPFKH